MVMIRINETTIQPNLDVIFMALADPTRHAILSKLVNGEASVKDITTPFKMSQPAISKHLKVLERAGLVERSINQQSRPARLNAEKLSAAVDWLSKFEAFWRTSFDQLDDVLLNMKQNKDKERDNE